MPPTYSAYPTLGHGLSPDGTSPSSQTVGSHVALKRGIGEEGATHVAQDVQARDRGTELSAFREKVNVPSISR